MSTTKNLGLFKHDNPETNTEKFDIENYLNGNWDKIDENAKEVNTNISNINSKDIELEKELKEAQEDFYQNSIRGQASGEYIHVEDSSNCRAKIGIGGNSEQETSPSPDYQSPIKTVGSNVNIFDIIKYDYRYLAGASVQINDKTNFRITATMNNNANCAVGFKILDLTKYAGKTLTVKAYAKSSTSANKAFIVLRQNDSDYTGTKSNELFDESQNTTDGVITLKYKITDTINDSNRYLFIWFYATRGVACKIGDYVDYKVKLVEGTEVGEYSKNGQGCVKVTKCNKNLFDKNTTTDGKYIGGNGSIQTQSNIMYSDYIQIKTNINYYITGRSEWSSVVLYDKNKTFLERISTTQPNGVLNITNSNCKYIIINALLTNKDTLQIEEKTATAYEEHQEQSYIIPTQQPFRAIGNVRDTFIKKNNKWYERHNIKEVILTGDENWTQRNQGDGTNTVTFNINLLNVGAYGSNNVLCDKFVYEQNSASGNEGIGFESILVTQYIQINRNRLSSPNLEGFKAWLSNNNIKLYYVLKIPEDIECTEEQSKILDELENARTYKNVTNITTDSIAILDLDYAKDLETLLTSKESEV